MPTVALLATGGTIASTGGPDGRVPTATGRDLLRQAGLSGGETTVPVRDLELGGSFSWDLEKMRLVVEEMRAALAAPVPGTDGARRTAWSSRTARTPWRRRSSSPRCCWTTRARWC